MPGGNRHDEPWPINMAENMGSPACTAARTKNCDGGTRPPHRCHSASDLGGWHNLPAGCSAKSGLTTKSTAHSLTDRRLSRSRRDVVLMMPWSGLSLTPVKYAYEMGTSELHRTSIMLAAAALTTNRSMYPKDLSRKPRRKPGRTTKITKEPLWRINCFERNRLTGTPPLPKS